VILIRTPKKTHSKSLLEPQFVMCITTFEESTLCPMFYKAWYMRPALWHRSRIALAQELYRYGIGIL
jgi:hypothetical protein